MPSENRPTSLKDYPPTLKFNAAAYTLAQALFLAKVETYGGADRQWSDLSNDQRRNWNEYAQQILTTLQPKILREPSSLEQFAANLARGLAGGR